MNPHTKQVHTSYSGAKGTNACYGVGVKKIFKNLPLILLFSAIALSPSYSAGIFGPLADSKIIELRIEDFLIVILGLVWIANFLISGRRKVKKPPLFFPILAWVGIGFVSLLTNWIFTNLSLDRGFFYFLKEIEFFIFYFYIFYHIKNIDSAKFLIKLWIFLGAVNVGYVIYQMVVGYRFVTTFGFRTGEYGTAALGEWGVFPTGAFFLIIFIFLLNIFLYYFLNSNISKIKKGILGIVAVGPVLGVFGTGSITNFLGLIIAVILTLFFLFLKKKTFKLVFISILFLIFIVVLFNFSLEHSPTVKRLLPVLSPDVFSSSYKYGRVIYWTPFLEEISEFSLTSLLIGVGKGYVGDTHNQFLRNFVETGIIGSLAFLFLIFTILKISFKRYLKDQNSFSLGLSAGLLVATLVMLFLSLATDSFIVVKPVSVYWSFAAITMAVLAINKRKKNYAKQY